MKHTSVDIKMMVGVELNQVEGHGREIMILQVKMLRDDHDMLITLPGDKYEICDTVDTWLVKNSNSNTVAVFDKFSTISIALYEEE